MKSIGFMMMGAAMGAAAGAAAMAAANCPKVKKSLPDGAAQNNVLRSQNRAVIGCNEVRGVRYCGTPHIFILFILLFIGFCFIIL